MKRKIIRNPSDQVKINCKFDDKRIFVESNDRKSKMVIMGPEVTVDLGVGYGNIDKVQVTEGYGIQYSEDGVKKLKKVNKRGSQHISEVRYRTDRPPTPILEQLPRSRPGTPLTPGSAHVSELHYRHGAVSPSVHKTEIEYNVGKYDENQNVFMNISSAPSPPPNRPYSGSWGPEPFWAAPHDVEKAKLREKEAKLKTPPPNARVASPLDNKLVQMAEPTRPSGKDAYNDRYSSNFDEYKRQEMEDKKMSLLSRRGYDGDLSFDFESDPMLSTRVIKRRKNKPVDRSDSPKRLSDPSARQEWEDEIARKLEELGHRSAEEEERSRPRSRAEQLSRDSGRMLELMGSEIGGKVKTVRDRTDQMMTQREDELAVDYSAEVEEDDRTDAENINKASNIVMRKLHALLADLQSTTSHIANYQQGQEANLQHEEPLLSRDTAGLAASRPAGESVIVPNHYEAVNRRPDALLNSNDVGDGRVPGAASTATRELDDLMDSLSDFKVADEPAHVGEPPYAQPIKPKGAQQAQPGNIDPNAANSQRAGGPGSLDNMLGNLNADMTKQGIMTVPKGSCAACQKPIVGLVMTALGKIWHPEHFQCAHCNVELGTQNFFERDGLPYCEKDYHQLFSPMCAACGGPILDKCMTALDATWHPEHFACASCGAAFGEEGYHVKDGKAYCREDYFSMFAPKCGGCSRPIMDNYISALNRQWHPECFVCMECGFPFGSGSFFDHDGLPYCETHYHAKRGSLCAGCHKPITGRCITAMYKKFHPEHFVCAFCLKQLNKGTFKEQNDKPYCQPCFTKLFG